MLVFPRISPLKEKLLEFLHETNLLQYALNFDCELNSRGPRKFIASLVFEYLFIFLSILGDFYAQKLAIRLQVVILYFLGK